MVRFQYTALDAAGKQVAGTLDAPARPVALKELRDKGLAPVRVEAASATAEAAHAARRGRFKKRAAEDFCRELSNLLTAGIAMSRALGILVRQARPNTAGVLKAIHEDVTGGSTLAEAMRQAGGAFTRVQIAMVQAGEAGGFLDVVLGQIADFQARERDLRGRIMGAMAYPLVLAGVSAAVLIFLLSYFIPNFSQMFTDLGGQLPLLTRGVVGISHMVVNHGPIMLVVLVLGILIVRRAMKSPAGRAAWEKFTLRLPVVGRLAGRLALVRFTRMLGTLIAAGVPLVAALRVAREALGNEVLAEAIREATEEVVRGGSLSASLRSCPQLFPLSVVETLAVAEEAGLLDKELQRLADVHEKELDRRLHMAVSMAEPLLLFVMAALVGTIVIGMLLPIFTLQELVK